MISLHIKGVRDSLRFRWSEWVASGVILGWGLSVGAAGDALGSPGWAWLHSWGISETIWGGIAAAVGYTRFVVLAWNGRWERCHEARWVMAMLSASFWFLLIWSLVMTGGRSTGLSVYFGYFVLDLGIIHISQYDAKRLYEARRDGLA